MLTLGRLKVEKKYLRIEVVDLMSLNTGCLGRPVELLNVRFQGESKSRIGPLEQTIFTINQQASFALDEVALKLGEDAAKEAWLADVVDDEGPLFQPLGHFSHNVARLLSRLKYEMDAGVVPVILVNLFFVGTKGRQKLLMIWGV